MFFTALKMRVIFARSLFSRHGVGLGRVLDHPAHVADTLGALGLALVTGEDVARTDGSRLDRAGHITLAETVAVADVHGETL